MLTIWSRDMTIRNGGLDHEVELPVKAKPGHTRDRRFKAEAAAIRFRNRACR
jgi:hypothetical protein